MPAVVVVGAGVSGLTTALELLERGHDVEVWSREPTERTVSAVAAAIWLPYLAEPRDRVLRWSTETFAVLRELAGDPATGVRMQPLRIVYAAPAPPPWWADAVGALRHVAAADLPAGYRAAIDLVVPFCDTTIYLPWLRAAVEARGGRLLARAIDNLEAAFADAVDVVNCTGLGARELCDDDQLVPVRGQVVRVASTPLPFAVIDDTDPDQPIYVLPRGADVVLGGTAVAGDERTQVLERDTAAIRAACARHFPELADRAVLGASAGLRPYRPAVRLELIRSGGRRLVHNYGHGGSGFTLSWGCAHEVAALLG